MSNSTQPDAVRRCQWGHELTEGNLAELSPDNWATGFNQECLACTRAHQETARHKLPRADLRRRADRHYRQIISGTAPQQRPGICPRNHRIAGDNIKINSNGNTVCRACHVARTRIPTPRTLQERAQFQELADQVFAAGGTLPPLPRKPTCARGHKLLTPNLVPSARRRGVTVCLACNRASVLRNNRKKSGIAPEHIPEMSLLADRYYAHIMARRPGQLPRSQTQA